MNDILKPRIYHWNNYKQLPGYKTSVQIAELAGCTKQHIFNILKRNPDIKGFRVGNSQVIFTDKVSSKLVDLAKMLIENRYNR